MANGTDAGDGVTISGAVAAGETADVTAAKPDPQGILKALDVMKVAKNDVLYIGDSVVDARTAENAGVDFAPVTTGMTRAEEFAPYRCVRILSDLSELV